MSFPVKIERGSHIELPGCGWADGAEGRWTCPARVTLRVASDGWWSVRGCTHSVGPREGRVRVVDVASVVR